MHSLFYVLGLVLKLSVLESGGTGARVSSRYHTHAKGSGDVFVSLGRGAEETDEFKCFANAVA